MVRCSKKNENVLTLAKVRICPQAKKKKKKKTVEIVTWSYYLHFPIPLLNTKYIVMRKKRDNHAQYENIMHH